MKPLQFAVVFVLSMNLLLFALTVKGLGFRLDGKTTRGILVLKAGFLSSVALQLWIATRPGSVTGLWAVVGLVVLALSQSFFWWAFTVNRKKPLTLAYSTDIPEHFVKRGPYRIVRHPFYASYLLTYVGALAAARSPVLIAVVVIMGAIYYVAARSEEQKFASSPFAGEYDEYRRKTGMFFPKLW